ncbi:MAG: LacI family transcriptional regulator [Hyphomicrobiales bacterium]|nr:MAG: LacI family transcriptional regulator [Hyphomicrobiales bacterium]
MDRSANQQDVARAAGVSVSTVSRALANSRSISAELRSHIQQLAADLGYRARGGMETVSARVYVTGNVMSGGLVSFYGAVMDGMSEAAREGGITLDVRLVPPVFDTEKLRRDAEDTPTGGTFLVGLDPTPGIAELLPAGHPLILVNGFDPEMRFDCVGPNNFFGAASATQRLLAAGHRHILHLRDQVRWTTLHRQRGFESAIARTEGATAEIIDIRDHADAAIAEAVRRKLAGAATWTAVFAVHDNAAIRFIHAMQQAGLKVPEDVSVVGFDNLPPAAMVTPRLATMQVDCAALGRQAIELLQRRLADPAAAIIQVECRVAPVAGGTIAPLS